MSEGGYKHILCEETDDGILTITLNRPGVFNAFNRDMGWELDAALTCFGADENQWFCILTGAGDKAFCSGEDLRNIDLDASAEEQEKATREALESYHNIVLGILGIEKPIVAALNGTVAGAGLSIALACDERFGVDGDKNMLIPGFAKIGLVPDAGMIALLERLIGYLDTKEWLDPRFTCSMRNATDLRLISRLGIDTEGMLRIVTDHAHNMRDNRSLAEFGVTKTLLNEPMIDLLCGLIFDLELKHQVELEQGEDFREGLVAFKEKRKPSFNARLRPPGYGEAKEVKE